MTLKSGVSSIFLEISSKFKSPCVAPKTETTPAEFIEPARRAFSISMPHFAIDAQNVYAKASPAPSVEVTGPSNGGQ